MHFNLFNSAILIVKEIYFVLDFVSTNIGANIYNFFIS